jgi:GT2 family glycosyltransferase
MAGHLVTSRLSVVIVSANSGHWLRPCLRTLYEHRGDLDLDVVVVAADCTDDTVALVESEFPAARTVVCANHGFAYGNNRGFETIDTEWVLFLNPDTEVREGTLSGLLEAVSARPSVGLVGVRQITADGRLFPTIRRFPSATRQLFEALGCERYPFRASWLGERELDLDVYERDVPCDWTSGSFMLARSDVLRQVGGLDERFFLFSEETDLCLRIRRAGWDIRHLPDLTILHHADKAGYNERLDAQAAFAKRQYVEKHFSRGQRAVAIGALAFGYGLRAVLTRDARRRSSSRAALATVLDRRSPPFAELQAPMPAREAD